MINESERRNNLNVAALMQNLTGRRIITLATLLVLGISTSTLFPTPAAQLQEAWAHQDPVGCSTPNSQIGITAFRGITPILGLGPVVQGETITFQANLDAASIADRCSREDGSMTIANPHDNKLLLPGTVVTPAGGIPCIGVNGANNFDDTDPPAPNGPNDGTAPDGDDCDEGTDGDADPDNRMTVLSNTLNYVVNCTDTQTSGLFAGQLLATAIWAGGFDHIIPATNVDASAGTATSQRGLTCVVPMIEWEKRLQSTTTPHPLQGGAIFRVTPNPFDATAFLLVTDNVLPDVDTDAGQIKLNATELGGFTITEETAPANCVRDLGARFVNVAVAAPSQVVGTQGVDNDGGDINERDFHNQCPGMIEWEKRDGTNPPPHPLQGGATFKVTPNPFTGIGTLTVVDNGIGGNDVNGVAGQIKVNGTLPGQYTVEETAAPPGCTLDNGDRVVTVTVGAPNQVIGTQGVDNDGGDINERDFHNICPTQPTGNIIVKTIHAEKQNYTSTLEQGNIPIIVDVTIIAEIYEDFSTKTIIEKHVVVVECIKQEAPAKFLGCEAYVPDDNIIPVKNCSEVPLRFPPVMNTVINKAGIISESDASNMNLNTVQRGNTAKTIDAQKEVFECLMNTLTDPSDDKKVDLLLFTEIFENLNTQTSDDPQILSLKCVTRINTHTVESCRFENQPL